MNPLIERLSQENQLTVPRLKQIYRELCKQTHPDITRGQASEFIKLREEYLEAMSILTKGFIPRPGWTPPIHPKPTFTDPRHYILENLYLYSIKVLSEDAEKILLGLIDVSQNYRADVADILTRYYQVLIRNADTWKDSGRIFYTHNILVSAIREMFYYYSYDTPRYKTLFLTYLKDLERRSKLLTEEQRIVLIDFAEWLKEEIDGEKIPVL